jgi:hypothetical protein
MSDHYDPSAKVLRLSPQSRSCHPGCQALRSPNCSQSGCSSR